MQPNANLVSQNFIFAKSGCYKPTTLRRNLALEIQMRSEITKGDLL
jgi:hypothetical protein